MSIDKDLLDRLMEGRAPGDLFGKEGILSELTKALAERALTTEMDEQLGHNTGREVFVIINGRIVPPPNAVTPRVLKIGAAALGSLTYAQTVSDLYKIHAITERDDMEARFGWTPDTFVEEPTEAFDPVYMRKLYDYGHDLAASGELWSAYPPYFAARDNHPIVAVQGDTIARASN